MNIYKPFLFYFIMSATLRNPECNFYFWHYITFQVTEFDRNDIPTQKITPSNVRLYTSKLIASPHTKLGIKVRNESSVPATIMLRIQAGNHTSYKTITLENNAYKNLVYVSADCSMKITHILPDDHQPNHQHSDDFWFHVIGINQPSIR